VQRLLDEKSSQVVDFDTVLDKIGFGLFQTRIFIALFILSVLILNSEFLSFFFKKILLIFTMLNNIFI